MTCIVALVDETGEGYIACDSLGSNGTTKNVYRTKKIFRRGGFLFGFTSSYRMGQILQYSLSLPTRKVGQDLTEYLHTDFVLAVRNAFDEGGHEGGGEFIFVTEGRIFTMQSNFSILEALDAFESVGSGEDYARATMSTMSAFGLGDPETILTVAIETAANYVSGVGGDIHHLTCE
jgi:ATP-dependent protease HslVU (ClpYQ) peptidase subunit